MKVLFAVSNEEITESIVKKYQKNFKQIISYKNVYYFNAILKELQKDKTYDRVVISEELEEFTHNQYEQIDKFIFEKMDSISDEALNSVGDDIPIILICSDRREKGESILVKLFGIGVYNAIIGNDRSVDEVTRLINRPRPKKEAKLYYKIDAEDVNYQAENENDVSEVEIQNILAHYKRLGKNEEMYIDAFKNISEQYNDTQLRVITKFLPANVRAVLEVSSPEYQRVMSFANSVSNNLRKEATEVNKPKTSEKLLNNSINAKNTMSKPVVIPSAINMNSTKKMAKPKPVKQIEEIERPPVEINTKQVLEKEQVNIKKAELENVLDNNMTEEPSIEKQEKEKKEEILEIKSKTRGRPKKVQTEEAIEQPVKKGRGRPKKQNQIEVNQQSFIEVKGIKEFDKVEKQEIEKSKIEEETLLPGFEDVEVEDEEALLPGFGEVEVEDEEALLPGFGDVEVEDEETLLPGFGDVEVEDEETLLPGFGDVEAEDEEALLPGLQDVEVKGETESTGFGDVELDEEEILLPGFGNVEADKEEADKEEAFIPKVQNVKKEEYSPIRENEEKKGTNNFQNNYQNSLQSNIRKSNADKEYTGSKDISYLLTQGKKVISFVGPSKNGTSFIVNNIAELLSNSGVDTAILDTTQNRNSYYIYTKNEEDLRSIARKSNENLYKGSAKGIQVHKNLTVYTSLPNEEDEYIDNVDKILETLLTKHSVILIDSDYETNIGYFKQSGGICLIQTYDILTIQPLTVFLRNLKSKNILDENKLKVVLNKSIRVKGITDKNIIGGMAFYNDPSMSYMTELFDMNTVEHVSIPFDPEIYVEYLQNIIECEVSLKRYSKTFLQVLNQLANMIYPNSSNGMYRPPSVEVNNNSFSPTMNNTLEEMKNKY